MTLKKIKNHLFKISTFFTLCFFIFIFSSISGFAQSIDDKEAILSIGDVVITQYEFEKNLNIFKSSFIRKNKCNPTSNDIEKWIQNFIDHTYFLADAYQKGFDTLELVNKRVTSMAHLIVSQPGGLLDKKMVNKRLSLNKNEIKKTLRKVEVREQYQKTIEKKARIKINATILLQLQKFLQSHGPLHEFDKVSLVNLLQANIMSYKENFKSKTVSVDQFMDYYNFLPLKKEIKNSDDLVYYIKSMVFDAYAYKKAQEYGLTQENKFLLDKENYKNEVIYYLYNKNVLNRGLNVSDEEVKNIYDLNRFKFKQAKDVNVSIYYFEDRNNALLGMFRIKRGNVDITNLQGLENIERNKILNYQSNVFSDSIKSLIFDLKIDRPSKPILTNGKFMVVVKESESGKRIKSLDEVEDILVKKIEDRKLNEKKRVYLSMLKCLYPIRNKINYQNYLTIPNPGYN